MTEFDGVNVYDSAVGEHYVGDCQNYGPLLGPYYNTGPNTGPNLGDPKRDHDFDSPPCCVKEDRVQGFGRQSFGSRD